MSCSLCQATVINTPVMCNRYAVQRGEAFIVTQQRHAVAGLTLVK